MTKEAFEQSDDMVAEEKQSLLKASGKADPENPQQRAPEASMSSLFGASYIVIIFAYYSAVSSTMLVINKAAIHYIQAPVFVMFCQLATSAALVKAGEVTGCLQSDKLEWDKIQKFLWVVSAFVLTIFCNIKVLQNANVETFITFRSSTPLVFSVMDYLFLGRMLPSLRSWICLIVLALAAIGYVLLDDAFKLQAYVWLICWYACFTFDAVYVKHVCDTVKMTNWGRVYYTNLLACAPLLVAFPLLGEHSKILTLTWTHQQWFPLLLSCFVGLGMSHASYLLREVTSATMFTMVGILCKIITVVINYFLWENHASLAGIACLMICVLAGTFYQQAPKRAQ